jgi:hypothetical protein
MTDAHGLWLIRFNLLVSNLSMFFTCDKSFLELSMLRDCDYALGLKFYRSASIFIFLVNTLVRIGYAGWVFIVAEPDIITFNRSVGWVSPSLQMLYIYWIISKSPKF